MKQKIHWKLFGLLYLAILAMNVFQVVLLGQAVSETVGVFIYLIFNPLITFAKYSAFILAGYILFDLIKPNRENK